jgi:signal transduction histidine kinase/DNA-binding response OmpR family regulator
MKDGIKKAFFSSPFARTSRPRPGPQAETSPVVYLVLAVCLAGVFIADVETRLGIAVWVVYLVPVMISLFAWRPFVPVVVAAAAIVLAFIGYLFSPAGVNLDIARINRSLGILTICVVSTIAYTFIRYKLALRKEEWLQTGHTRLSEQMSGDLLLEQLGEKVLSFLSEYVGAHAGAFFIQQQDGFQRFATYAVPSPADIPERFTAGEGLLGQAAKDRRSFLVPDVPDGYLSIGSALGRKKPEHLLIAPFMVDGTANGVIELGFIHPVDPSCVELFERVSQSIAITIRSSNYRTRQQELLEETQRQAEELHVQSEELRTANEEITEKAEILAQSQARLENQQSELEETNAQLEEQTQTLEMQKDDLGRAKEALEAQARELEQTSQYKSDFLANMSHELRTPLNSSLILAKLLADNPEGNLTAEQVRYAQTIQSSGNDLLALITEILDLSKIEAGRLEVHSEPVSIPVLFDQLQRAFQPIATEKGLKLRTHVEESIPRAFETDPLRLSQIMKNLLSNAVKFTENGQISLKAKGGPDGFVSLIVRDTGIGIPEHQRDMIFEPFRQADGTTNRKYGGTGLGLSISRELAHRLGGRIELTSEVGVGSEFAVVLPEILPTNYVHEGPDGLEGRPTESQGHALSSRPSAASIPNGPAPESHAKQIDDDREKLTGDGRIILVIEDDEAFARILCDLAHELGFLCLIATTAQEALTLSARHLPSAVVLDIGLPDSSGLSVLGKLKRDLQTRHIPVHVVSISDYTETALSLGAVGYILKPVKREQLVQAFKRLETRFTQKLRRVLIVEDDDVQLESLQLLLGSGDVETVPASSAAECLDVLKTSTVDCMVLDLNLPDASGFSLLETISKEEAYSFPPVIVYTGRELTVEEEQRLRRYSKSIIIKGAKSPERLLDEVTLFLHQVVSELPPEQQRMLEKARDRDAVLEGKQILVVEDDVRNVYALTSVLEPTGARVLIARNGREALQCLEQFVEDGGARIDLVLMDIMMPEMDGLTATREIRQRPEWKNLPVIALTAKAMPDDQEKCLAAGANDYMAKPLDVEKLLSLVRIWIRR